MGRPASVAVSAPVKNEGSAPCRNHFDASRSLATLDQNSILLLKMVFADKANCAGLRAFVSHLLDEADFGTDCQTVEGVIENAVAMKIDLAAIGGFDESVILSGEEFRHMAMVLLFMRLDVAAHLAHGVFNLTLRSAEGVLDRDREVLVLRRVFVTFSSQ